MTRFVDPEARRTVILGPCDCPASPHEQDEAYIRDRLSGQEIAEYTSSTNETIAAITAQFILGWNLLGPKGEAVEVTAQNLILLDAPTLSTLMDGFGEVIERSVTPLPNGSAVRSRATSRANGSPTRTTRPRR